MKFIKAKSEYEKKLAKEYWSKLIVHLSAVGGNLARRKMKNEKRTYLIQVNGEFIGCFCLCEPRVEFEERELWRGFYRLWIEPKHRNKGYGTKTMLKIMNDIVRKDETLYLTCFKENVKARKFYKLLGFDEIPISDECKEIYYTKRKK
ncbi:MAG: GNAT family N-acetyltransferase [Paraclostridium sp.]